MKKIKQLTLNYPECYFLLLVILVGYKPPVELSSISLWIVFVIVLQLIFKNKISGLILASIFLVINIFMLGAVLSEFKEFTEFNSDALQLLLGGLSIWCLNIYFAVSMFYKYLKQDISNDSPFDYKPKNA